MKEWQYFPWWAIEVENTPSSSTTQYLMGMQALKNNTFEQNYYTTCEKTMTATV